MHTYTTYISHLQQHTVYIMQSTNSSVCYGSWTIVVMLTIHVICMRAQWSTHTHTHTHTHVRKTHQHTNKHARFRTCTHAYMHASVHTQTDAQTDTQTDAHTHTHSGVCEQKHSSREEEPWEDKLPEHQARRWMGASAAGLRAKACAEGFLFHRLRYYLVSVKRSFLLCEPWPCNPAAGTPILPLIWCFLCFSRGAFF